MGFDLQATRFVLEAFASGADFTEAATLGRQSLNINRNVYRAEAKRFGLDASTDAVDQIWSTYPYVDGLMRELGAMAPALIDMSDYKGATFITDMNSRRVKSKARLP